MRTFLSSSFSNDKIRSLFTPWKLGSVKKSKNWFCLSRENFGLYLFQSIVLLKPDFNCCNSFSLSWVDIVVTGIHSFVSVISNFVAPVSEEITKSPD